MIPKVRKAVFPAAGLGTRFLPATKAQPKEMLPLVDKPLIQYGVEEAIHSGIQNIIIVTGRGKTAIEDHFDVSFELEQTLEAKGKKDLLKIVRDVSDMIDVSYVRQKEALGLGHAVLRAKELVGNEPFAVVLSDDVIDSEIPCHPPVAGRLRVLWRLRGRADGSARRRHLGLRRGGCRAGVAQFGQGPAVPHSQHGGEAQAVGSAVQSRDHRPLRSDARRSSQSIEAIEPGSGGEIQLTDALKHLLRNRPIYGYRFEGTRYDAGDKLGFLKATVEFALQRYDLGGPFREYLKQLKL